MTTWTQAASVELRGYLARLRDTLGGGEADPDEVVDDMRRHVEEELAKGGYTIVTVEDLRKVLARMGLPEPAIAGVGPSPVVARTPAELPPRPPARPVPQTTVGGTVMLVIFGVLLPTAAIVAEVAYNACSDILFDPFPTVAHVVLALLVPAAVLSVVVLKPHLQARRRRAMGFATAFAFGVGLFYSLLFLPLLPVSVLGVIVFGLGLLPLSPLLSTICLGYCRRRVRTADGGSARRAPAFWWGLGAAAMTLLLVQLPSIATQVGLQWAVSDSAAMRGRGLFLLRTLGSEEQMLQACYTRRQDFANPITFVLTFGEGVKTADAQAVYYRVTGLPFSHTPAPESARRSLGLFRTSRAGWDWDFEQGGDQVAGRLKGLLLAESRLDGLVDADAAWSYTEWTMVFRNDHNTQREARAQIHLPPGGVVSRLTLWVNGQECEAAFSGTSDVKAAYQQVAIRQRRDPVLVTRSGPDRVMMQCFPVPANGGQMKIRIGITAPVQLTRLDEGYAPLPAIIERNFTIRDDVKHAVWMESKSPLSDFSGVMKAEHPKPTLYAVRGSVSDEQLSARPAAVGATRRAEVSTSWSPTRTAGKPATTVSEQSVVVQKIDTAPSQPPARVVVVVDASRGMSAALGQVASALTSLPAGMELSVLVAGDDVAELTSGVAKVSDATTKDLAQRLAGISCRGGPDAVPALCRAWDIAAESPRSLILWVHGAQPVVLGSIEPLKQYWQRRPDGPSLLCVQAAPGPNRIVDDLPAIGDIGSLARRGEIGDDLKRLFFTWTQNSSLPRVTRSVMDGPAPSEAVKTDLHLARLWANEEVGRLVRRQRAGVSQEAVQIATNYQLVTPVSGAVVLETAAQYAANNLQPVDPASVPTVPEPETWALLVVVAVAAGWAVWRTRRARRVAA